MHVSIIDYGSGNLHSTFKAFEISAKSINNQAKVTLAQSAEDIQEATHIVLPGVGAFGDCKAGLEALDGMTEALRNAAIYEKKPFLGICVGMQLLAEVGLEHGSHKGLGWIPGSVEMISPQDKSLKIPHMGWNALSFPTPHPLFSGIKDQSHVYFTHSYHMTCKDTDHVIATTDYSGSITAAVARGNIMGTQFHPEKSQSTGLRIIRNFIEMGV